MSISISCERCFRHCKVKDNLAGLVYKCKQCGDPINVPGGQTDALTSPRELRLNDPMRKRLFQLRCLSGVQRPPEIKLELVRDVETTLKCQFPDVVLAMFANGDDYLDERSISLEAVVDNTQQGRECGVPKDLVAIGQEDGHQFFCIERKLNRDAAPSVIVYDNEDQSLSSFSLTEWLEKLVEESLSELAESDYTSFRPRLV